MTLYLYHNCLIIYRYMHVLVQAPLFLILVKPMDNTCVCTDIALVQHTTVLRSKRVDFFLTLHAHLFLPIMNRNITFSSSISVQSVKQRPLRNRSYDEL